MNRETNNLEWASNDHGWRDFAECKDMPVEIFFPPSGGAYRLAREICKRCAVIDDCLEFALKTSTNELGIFGGYTKQKRRKFSVIYHQLGSKEEKKEFVHNLTEEFKKGTKKRPKSA